MSDRSKVPEGYGITVFRAGDHAEWCPEILRAEEEYSTEAAAIAACHTHRDAILREELERLLQEVADHPTPNFVKENGYNDGYQIGTLGAASIIRARLAQLEDPDAK